LKGADHSFSAPNALSLIEAAITNVVSVVLEQNNNN
jgi:hypothetical protein